MIVGTLGTCDAAAGAFNPFSRLQTAEVSRTSMQGKDKKGTLNNSPHDPNVDVSVQLHPALHACD